MSTISEEQIDWDSWDPMSEDYHSAKNTLSLNPDSEPECELTGKMMSLKVAGKEVCDHFIRYGSCADGKFCDRIHVTPQARDKLWSIAETYDLNKTRTCLTYNYLSPIELEANRHTLLLVSIAQIKSPSEFVFVAPYEQMDFSKFNEDEVDFYLKHVYQTSPYKTKLQKCHDQLAALFDHDYRLDDLNEDIFLSQIVACKLENGRFCRAMVIELDDYLNDKFDYQLYLIDIGITVYRPREQIYDIRASCLSEPPLAVAGRLDLRPANGDVSWPSDVLGKFQEKLKSKKFLLCKVMDYITQDRIYTVDLMDLKSRISFTDKMIESKFAEPCQATKKNETTAWDDL